MRTKSFFAVLICCILSVWLSPIRAQQQPNLNKPVAELIAQYHQSNFTFSKPELFVRSSVSSGELKKVLLDVTMLHVDADGLASMVDAANGALELSIPYNGRMIIVDLVKVNIFTEDFKVETNQSEGKGVPYEPGIYYRGIVKGDNTSLVAFSFFKDELVGLISTDRGNIVVAKLRNKNPDEYIAYSDRDLINRPGMACYTPDDPSSGKQLQGLIQDDGTERTTNCVRFFYELDYDLFENNEMEIPATANWITALHNNVATLYSNDLITTSLSGIFLWTTPDPYTGTSAISELFIFKEQRPFFNGDLAQLLSMEPGDYGGVASGINTFCNSSMKYSYSDIDYEYHSVPAYSWTIDVVAHEFGHLMGSPHTHNCDWPGGAIDDCGPIAGFPNEGTCPLGPNPIGGGTIMSYCHLTNFGINFNKGFGLLPANAIREAVNNASCLTGSCEPNLPSYCPSEGKTAGEWIQSVQMGDFMNNSGQGIGYSDFTNQVAYLAPGSIVTVMLTPGYSGTHYEEYFSVWLDLNQDLDFSDPSEIVYQSPGVTSTVTGTFIVPVSLSGNTRIRISMKFDTLPGPCEFFKYGEVEDYSATFTPIVTYCASSGNHADKEWIDYVKLGALERVSGSDSGYFDGTAMGTVLLLGSTNTITHSAGMAGYHKNEYWRGWIDFNQDGDFYDSDEKILARHSKNVGFMSKTFTVPTSASMGKTRMRISMKRNSSSEPCEAFTHGEVEDFSVIIAPQSPAPVQAHAIMLHLYPNPSSSQVTAEWESDVTSGIIELLDLTGRVLLVKPVEQYIHSTTFDMGNLSHGIYIIRMTGNNAMIFSAKVIKE